MLENKWYLFLFPFLFVKSIYFSFDLRATRMNFHEQVLHKSFVHGGNFSSVYSFHSWKERREEEKKKEKTFFIERIRFCKNIYLRIFFPLLWVSIESSHDCKIILRFNWRCKNVWKNICNNIVGKRWNCFIFLLRRLLRVWMSYDWKVCYYGRCRCDCARFRSSLPQCVFVKWDRIFPIWEQIRTL